MKKINTFMKFLETVNPLDAEVYYSPTYDMKVYKTTHSYEDRDYITKGHPLGYLNNKERFFELCVKHVSTNEPKAIQEFLFYDTKFEQGMIMAYRPDSLRKGIWCLVVITVLPFRKHAISPKHTGTKKVIVEKLIKNSSMPSEILRYLLEEISYKDLKMVINNLEKWDSLPLFVPLITKIETDEIKITIEKEGIKSISSTLTLRNLKLVELPRGVN